MRLGDVSKTVNAFLYSDWLGSRHHAARYISSITVLSSGLPFISFAMRPFGSVSVSFVIWPLIKLRACPRLTVLLRSHSQGDSRGGLPNKSKNPPAATD